MKRSSVFFALVFLVGTFAQAAEKSPGPEVFSQVSVEVVHQTALVRDRSVKHPKPEAVFLAKVTNGSKFPVSTISGRIEARDLAGSAIEYLDFSYVAPAGQPLQPGASIVPSRGFAIGDLKQPRTAGLVRVFATPIDRMRFGFIPDTIAFASGDAIQLMPVTPTIGRKGRP